MTHIEQYLVRNQYLIYQVSHTNYAVKERKDYYSEYQYHIKMK